MFTFITRCAIAVVSSTAAFFFLDLLLSWDDWISSSWTSRRSLEEAEEWAPWEECREAEVEADVEAADVDVVVFLWVDSGTLSGYWNNNEIIHEHVIHLVLPDF